MVVIGVVLLLCIALECTAWEVHQERPTLISTSKMVPQVLVPTHSMDCTTRGLVMLHTVTAAATRSTVTSY